ncbi:hypothetical protein D3C81_1109600 [compost metagenome]
MAVALQQALGHLAIERDVFHQQDVQRLARCLRRNASQRRGSRRQYDLEPEGAAFALAAVHADLAAHGFHQALADCQAEAGAAIAPRHFLAGLGEALENLRQRRRGDADAVVDHGEAQTLAVLALRKKIHLEAHLAVLGELHRVGHQVAQHLAQELFGATAGVMHLRLDAQAQAGAVLRGARFEQGEYVVEQLAQGEIHSLRLAGAVFQPGEAEHLVEDRQQPFAGIRQRLQPTPVLLAERRAAQQFGHAEDAVERRADFVAHGGEEARLGTVGRLGVLLGALQAGGAPLDPALQFVALVLQGHAVGLAAAQVGADRLAHVVQRVGHGVDLVLFGALALVQLQRGLQVAAADAPGEVGHHPQMTGDQAVEQPGQGHRQAAEEHAHPQQAGQPGGIEAPVDGPQIDGDFQLAQLPLLAGGGLVGQGKVLAAQRPRRVGAIPQVEVAAGQAYPGDVGEVDQAVQLHVQLLLVEVPQAAFEAGQVADADQLQARLDVAHLAAVFEVQLHGAGQHGEAQAEHQHAQQQAPRQAAGQLHRGTSPPCMTR